VKLRQVDLLTSQGQSVADAVRAMGVTELTYTRCRQEYGGLKTSPRPGAVYSGSGAKRRGAGWEPGPSSSH
jgi:hypothetical protein